MVGDILDDVEAGRRAGCRTVLLDNGNETEWGQPAMARSERRTSHDVAGDRPRPAGSKMPRRRLEARP